MKTEMRIKCEFENESWMWISLIKLEKKVMYINI